MSFQRIWRWTCDEPRCGLVVDIEQRGLPRGWTFLPHADGGTQHRCDACTNEALVFDPKFPAQRPKEAYASEEPTIVRPRLTAGRPSCAESGHPGCPVCDDVAGAVERGELAAGPEDRCERHVECVKPTGHVPPCLNAQRQDLP